MAAVRLDYGLNWDVWSNASFRFVLESAASTVGGNFNCGAHSHIVGDEFKLIDARGMELFPYRRRERRKRSRR